MSNFRLTFSAVCAILPLSAQLLLWGFADAAYPREGTVTVLRSCCSAKERRCSLSPRGDGYDGKYQAPRSRYLMQLIPARGRLLYSMSLLSHSFRCSLSPRGDGYKKNLRRLSTLKSMQLIPARGRLPTLAEGKKKTRGCSLSPRGDGYVKSIACRSLYFQMQLIPARGRLPELLSDDFNHKGMQLSPARGLRPYVFSGKFSSFY